MTAFGWNSFGWLFPVGIIVMIIGSIITIVNK
jgi:hypothetical protein